MDTIKRARLEAAGFKVGSPAEFLELTDEENSLVELRIALKLAEGFNTAWRGAVLPRQGLN